MTTTPTAPTPIFCKRCGSAMGTVAAPTKDELRDAARATRSPHAGLVSMIPADFLGAFSQWLTFTCNQCNGGESGKQSGKHDGPGFFDGNDGDEAGRREQHGREFDDRTAVNVHDVGNDGHRNGV